MGPPPAVQQIALLGIGMSSVLPEQFLTGIQHLFSCQNASFLGVVITYHLGL
jgi:hypothetical protein